MGRRLDVSFFLSTSDTEFTLTYDDHAKQREVFRFLEEFSAINVEPGTKFADLKLPEMVRISDNTGKAYNLPVTSFTKAMSSFLI